MSFNFTPLYKDPSLSMDERILLTLKEDQHNDASRELFQSLEDLDVLCRNLMWLEHHIDTLRTDHVFQDIVGLQLAQEGYTSSVEVAGGISKTMTTMWDKVTEFFQKLIRYLTEVMSVSTKASADLLRKLANKCQDPKNVDKLKKEYTTHGESTESIAKFLKEILDNQKEFQDRVDKLKALKTNEETVQAQGQEEQSKTEDNALTTTQDQLKKESGNGKDVRNTEDGMDPVNGKWFDATSLTALATRFDEMNTYIGALRNFQTTVKAIANDTKSNTQMSKEMAKTKLDTVKTLVKQIDNNVRSVMKYSTLVGKKCQVLLKIIEK